MKGQVVSHKLPKKVWDDMEATVKTLDTRVRAIEQNQKAHRNLLRWAIALIPVITAAIVTIIEAIKS